MKRHVILALFAALIVGSLTACTTHDTSVGQQPYRPPGSGGRGMSGQHEAHTSSGS